MENKEEYYTTNAVAGFIKGLAIFIAVIGIIASIIIGASINSFVTGLIGCVISVLSILLLYAIGEGLQILDDMKTNTEHIRDYLESEKNNMEKKSRKKSNIVNGTYIVVGIVVALFIVSMLGTFALLNISEPKEVEISNVNEEQETTTVPKVVGMEKEEAIKALEEVNLKAEVIEETSEKVEEGYVISQETDENTEAFAGDTVKIHISVGTENTEVIMANVLGQKEIEAKATLENLGLKVSVIYDEDSSKDSGVVLKQSISSGKIIDKGTTVTITVNKLN